MMIRKLSMIVIAVAVCVASTKETAHANDDTTNKTAASSSSNTNPLIKKLAWMQGQWRVIQGKDVLEDVWSEPLGDSVSGSFRWVKDGKVWMYELMTITVDDGKLVLRLRHFDRKQKPWEGPDAPLIYTAASVSENEVVFEDPKGGRHDRMIYRRTDANHLLCRLESIHDKSVSPEEFLFTRYTSE